MAAFIPRPPRQTFKYKPLNSEKREFRILRVINIHKKWGPKDDEYSWPLIRCRMEHVSMTGPVPSYKAISWRWGDPSRKRPILVNEKLVEIPKSAEETLRWICSHHKHDVVWLDAICIDQQNLSERGHQVAMMREIFSRAAGVLVWLGELPYIEEQHLKAIENVEGAYRKHGIQSAVANRTRIFSAFWFTRLWVVQEVMLNMEVTCFTGCGSIPWSKLSSAANWLWNNQDCWSDVVRGSLPRAGIEAASQVWRYTNKGYDYMDLLDMSIKLQSAKSVDKIYGMYGLLKSANITLGAEMDLEPDYHADFIDVYTNATRAALAQRSGRVDQLSIIHSSQTLVPRSMIEKVQKQKKPKKSKKARLFWDSESYECFDEVRPSWVPRYDWCFDRSQGFALSLSASEANASNGICTQIAMNCGSPHVLSLTGIVVDRIGRLVGDYPHSLLTDLSSNSEADQEFDAGIEKCREAAFANDYTACDLFTTLTCGHDKLLPDQSHLEVYLAGTYSAQSSEYEEPIDSYFRARISAAAAMERHACNGRFFSCRNGMIGMGPRKIETGDVVCILFGGMLPFVLRQESDHWIVVGNVYVHGIMNGEYVRWREAEGHLDEETRTFEIH